MDLDPKIQNLEELFSPQVVAIVGASRREGSIGRAILKNIIDYGFEGTVYPVNPKSHSVGGIRAYPDLHSIPDKIDLVIIVVPSRFVLKTIQDAAELGVKGCVIITAGFKEVSEEGAKVESEFTKIANQANMRLIGPNCMGIIHTHSRLNATFAPGHPLKGKIGFISQSGALGVVILNYAAELGLGFSKFVSLGNKADVNGTNLIENLGNDDNTDVILAYLESFSDPWNFSEIATKTSRKKPIILVKSGRTKAGAKAASSHTGALASSETALTATLNSSGVIRVSSVEELFACAAAFSKLKLPQGPNVCVITNSGGPGTLAVDALINQGLKLPELSESTIDKIKPKVSPEASISNPIDLIASGGPKEFSLTIEAVIEDDKVDSIIVIFVPPMMIDPLEIAKVIEEQVLKHNKPLLGVIMGKNELVSDTSMNRFHFPMYAFPESAVLALRALTIYANWKKLPEEKIEQLIQPQPLVTDIIDKAKNGTNEYLSQQDVITVLTSYGFKFPTTRIIDNLKDAIAIYRELNHPVVLKMASKSVSHKTEMGGVILDIRTEEELLLAWSKIQHNYDQFDVALNDRDVIIQKYYSGGVEMALGISVDTQFGPLVMIGSGGVLVEILDDVKFARVPVSRSRARQMIRRLKINPLLLGYRGDNPIDMKKLENSVLRLSQLAWDNRSIIELDINPLLALEFGEEPIVLDARIRIKLNNKTD